MLGKFIQSMLNIKFTICDQAFVKKGNSSDKCMMWQTKNHRPWVRSTPHISRKDEAINKTDIQNFSRSCDIGFGWKGSLEIEVQNDSFKLNWAALVKQPRCVERVILTDEKANLEKDFWTLENDDTFSIEYLNSTCEMKIRIIYKYKYGYGCYSVNTKVRCKNDEVKLRSGFRETENDSETDSSPAE